VPNIRTQLVAARTVAEALVDLATAPELASTGPIPEIAGPRGENLVDIARLLVERRGDRLQIVDASNASDPDQQVQLSGGLLPSPHAVLTGPTFERWLAELL